MSKYDSPLNNLRVASPCSMDWNQMDGDERKRFCGECKLNVYNLSGMTRYDAENLLRLSEGRLCVRYFQRHDGTIITKDCPVGWARVKQRVSIVAAAAFSIVLSVLGAFFVFTAFRRTAEVVVGKLEIPKPTPTPKIVPLMGAIAVPPKDAKPTPSPTPKVRKVLPVYEARTL